MKEQIDELLKKFKPKFGDSNSLHIVELVKKVNEERERVRKTNKTLQSIDRVRAKKTQAEIRLAEAEKSLHWALTNLETKV